MARLTLDSDTDAALILWRVETGVLHIGYVAWLVAFFAAVGVGQFVALLLTALGAT